jgi:hypothetical protein
MKKMINTNLMLLVFVCFTVPFFSGCDSTKMAPNSGMEMAGTETAKPKITEKVDVTPRSNVKSYKLGRLH